MRKYWLGIVAGGLFFGGLLILLGVRIPWFRFQQAIGNSTALTPVSQTFISYYPGLNAIAIQSADQSVLPDSLELQLYVCGESAPRLEVRRTVSELQAGGWWQFKFAPLDDSANITYTFVVRTEVGTAVELVAHQLDMYPEGELAGGGDLAFRVSYAGYGLPTVSAFLARVTAHKPGLLGQPGFYIGLVGVYIICGLGAGLALTRRFLAKPAAPKDPVA